jgi:hypothetical protein
MNTSEDRLDILKAKYLKQIDAKNSEIATIRQKLALLDELKAEADGLALFDPMTTAKIPTQIGGINLVSGAGLTETILSAVSSFGTKPFAPPAMRKHLLDHGFKPGGKNFSVSVGTTLKRLAAQNKILAEKFNGKTVYRAKP